MVIFSNIMKYVMLINNIYPTKINIDLFLQSQSTKYYFAK